MPTGKSIFKKGLMCEFHLFKKGLMCEFHGFGIAAYTYFRRIVEEIIEGLLEKVSQFYEGEEKEEYEVKLEEVRQTKNTSDKIDFVKDDLPPILTPGSRNPLKTLHKVLSIGIHNRTEEDCLRDAAEIKDTLIFLIRSIQTQTQKDYLESMDELNRRLSS